MLVFLPRKYLLLVVGGEGGLKLPRPTLFDGRYVEGGVKLPSSPTVEIGLKRKAVVSETAKTVVNLEEHNEQVIFQKIFRTLERSRLLTSKY